MDERTARKLVRERARERCEVCGGPGYEYSHRRTRAVRDEHRDCPCNALWSCRTCHARMHDNPDTARERGQHVSRFVDLPAEQPVMLVSGWWKLRCDGSVQFLQGARTDLTNT